MKTAYKNFTVYCDGNPEDYDCEQEVSWVLKVWERKDTAWKAIRNLGWYLSDEKDLCPYCRKTKNK